MFISLALCLPKKSLHKSNNFYKFASQNKFKSLPKPTFPYVFGGSYKKNQFKENGALKNQIASLFDLKKVYNGYKEAYRSIVHCLAENDVQTLKDTFEPNLLKNFQPKNVRLLNPDAEIQVVSRKANLLLRSTFIRDSRDLTDADFEQRQKLNQMVKNIMQNIDPKDFPYDLMVDQNFLPSDLFFFRQFPVLFSYEILFKSKMKLVPVEESITQNENTEEIHSVQFEIQTQIRPMKMIKKVAFSSMVSESFEEVLFGKDYEWKVGDFDKCLDGNFKNFG